MKKKMAQGRFMMGSLKNRESCAADAKILDPVGILHFEYLRDKAMNLVLQASKDLLGKSPDICRCLPPDTTWHKVKSPKAD